MGLWPSKRHVDRNTEQSVQLANTMETTRQRIFERRVALHKAALQGKWEDAEKLISECPSLANDAVTEGGETALHLAAAEGHVHFVEELVEKMDNPHIKNAMRKTALTFAATAGHVPIAEVMLRHDSNFMRNEGYTPLEYAAWQGHREMANYLFERSGFESWTEDQQFKILMRFIHSGLFDLAVKIVRENASLAVRADSEDGDTPLQALARKPLAFSSRSPQGFRCSIITTNLPCFKLEACKTSAPFDAYNLLDRLWVEVIRQEDIETSLGDRIKELLFTAAESGNDYFVIELIKRYPDFIYKTNEKGRSIFHVAILQRSVNVFSLTYEFRGVKDIMVAAIDDEKNNILHLAAKLPPQNLLNTIPGAALQMQREILWYKEVEKIIRPNYKNDKNEAEELTPHELFLKEHGELMKAGEKEIKQIAKSCMLVTTLITTIVFTSVFTAPGGYNEKGAPILRQKELFMILPISQAIATLASLISMLMFLSVLTSRYLENDFLKSLPLWLVVGVVALFLSIVAMMVAFCSCLFFYEPGVAVMVVLLVLFAFIPIAFLVLKGPLLVTMLCSTCSSKSLFGSKYQLF